MYYPIAMFQADLKASGSPFPVIRSQHKAREDKWEYTERSLLNNDIEYMIVHPDAVVESRISNGMMKIGYGAYHTLVMPHMEFISLKVIKKLKKFEASGGKVIWVGEVPHSAEHAKNNTAVKAALKNTKPVSVQTLSSEIPTAKFSQFDIAFSPGTDQLYVGRFLKSKQPIYLLVNRQQEAINVSVSGTGSVKILNPSTGKIRVSTLPAQLPLQGVRSLILLPL